MSDQLDEMLSKISCPSCAGKGHGPEPEYKRCEVCDGRGDFSQEKPSLRHHKIENPNGRDWMLDYYDAEEVDEFITLKDRQVIAAVRSALAPRVGELPERPELQNGDGAGQDYTYALSDYADTLESLLRASQAEVERLRGQLSSAQEWIDHHNKRADEAEFRLTTYNRERGDIANALVDVAVMLNVTSGSYALTGPELILLAESAKQAIEAERKTLTICREDERKRCLEEVYSAWRFAVNEVRDAVLNERNGLAESGIEGCQVNGVLGIIDDFGYPMAEQAIIEIGKGEK